MKKIRFKSLSKIVMKTDGYEPFPTEVADIDIIKQFDGVIYYNENEDNIFSTYFIDQHDDTFIKAGITGGILSFVFDEEKQKLFTCVEYELQKGLTNDEIEQLQEYTNEQLSDGIGSGIEQCFPLDTNLKEDSVLAKKYRPIVWDFYGEIKYIVETE